MSRCSYVLFRIAIFVCFPVNIERNALNVVNLRVSQIWISYGDINPKAEVATHSVRVATTTIRTIMGLKA